MAKKLPAPKPEPTVAELLGSISAAKSDKRRSRRSGRTPKAGHPGRNGRKPVKPFSPDPLSWFREERECMRNNIPHEDG